MTGSILWKAAVSLAAIAFALVSLLPLEDIPYRDYIADKVYPMPENAAELTAEEREEAIAELQKEWDELDNAALAAIEPEENPYKGSYYAALRDLANKRGVNLQPIFSDTNARDVANVNKRNGILLEALLRDSKAALRPGLDLAGGTSVTFRINPDDLPEDQQERTGVIAEAEAILAERIDGLGVIEPVIRVIGNDRIEVQMPGVSATEDPGLIDNIGRPARLEFSLVHRTRVPGDGQPPPIGFKEMAMEIENRDGSMGERRVYVRNIPFMRGSDLSEARASQGEFNRYEIVFRLTDEGARIFGDVTTQIFNEDRETGTRGEIATILDGKLNSAFGVRSPITGGSGSISGSFTAREAVDLARVLENPLETRLEVASIYEISPQLADESRAASVMAAVIGGVLVIVFMVIYYQMAGAVAITSVGVVIALLLGFLASLGATITLPGVAAIVLTIGMAVDANILIFERIREELNLGKSISSSLQAGYEKAFSTIIDANVTTLITALILIGLGSGPVRGFGITLAIGIGASVFCALIVSRMMLEFLVSSNIMRGGFRLNLFKFEGIPFLDKARPAFFASWVLVAVGVTVVVWRGDDVLGIDFTGGDQITVSYVEPVSTDEVENLAADLGLGEVRATEQTTPGTQDTHLVVQMEVRQWEVVWAAMQEAFPDAGLSLDGQTTIGATVSREVTTGALLSLGIALLLMILYISIRFEPGYAAGAVVATVHDILMTIGLFVLIGGQFSAPMVAAILMVVGYSINDTIVVFDRIREELELNPGMNLRKVIHIAINRTLSRTVLTSLTTMLATIALLIFAAGVVTDFALIFLFGILTGSFSSIFIASPIFYWWHKGDRKHVEERHDVLPKYDWDTGTKSKNTVEA